MTKEAEGALEELVTTVADRIVELPTNAELLEMLSWGTAVVDTVEELAAGAPELTLNDEVGELATGVEWAELSLGVTVAPEVAEVV